MRTRQAAYGRAAAPLAGLAAGLLLAASLPPWPVATGAWPLGLLGAAVLAGALYGRGWGARLAAGLACGLGLYAPGLWWMREFSVPGYVVVVLLEALILAGALVLVPGRGGTGPEPSGPDAMGRARGAVASLAAPSLPAALVLAEAVRGAWPFGGLPLAGIDLGQVAGPLGAAATVGGRLLVVALVGTAGVGLATLALGWRERTPRLAGAVVLGLVAGFAALAAAAPDGTAVGRLRVSAVQGGGPRGLRAIEVDPSTVLERHLAASAGAPPGVELVVWPEDVIDVEHLAGSPADEALGAEAGRLQATLVAGVVEDVERAGLDGFTNAAVAWGPDGRRVDRYDKVHRVPFGEYVPGRAFFERLADLSPVPRDAVAGQGLPVLRLPSLTLGVLISYEVFFEDRARAAVAAGGEVLAVPTNASSYQDEQVPAQEVAAARLRALETGRWVVQAAPTGYSAVVDPEGRVLRRSPLGARAVVTATVEARQGRTLASFLGGPPVVILAALALLAANLSGIRSGLMRFS